MVFIECPDFLERRQALFGKLNNMSMCQLVFSGIAQLIGTLTYCYIEIIINYNLKIRAVV